jgi:hypothetical protein
MKEFTNPKKINYRMFHSVKLAMQYLIVIQINLCFLGKNNDKTDNRAS